MWRCKSQDTNAVFSCTLGRESDLCRLKSVVYEGLVLKIVFGRFEMIVKMRMSFTEFVFNLLLGLLQMLCLIFRQVGLLQMLCFIFRQLRLLQMLCLIFRHLGLLQMFKIPNFVMLAITAKSHEKFL